MTLRTLLIKLGFKGDISKLTQFDRGISSLKGNVIGLSAVFATATTALGYFVNQAAKMERIQISFKVLAGGLKVSRDLLKDILEFAAVTPFEIPNVLETTKSLLAFGVPAKDMIETMREVGDVAAGMDKPLNILAQSYGRVIASGRLLGRVLYNLRLQGVPITEFLLKVTGEKTAAGLDHLVSQGKVTSDIFVKAWNMMRQQRFMNVLFEQANTFLGILSNIKDQVTLFSIAIGNIFLPNFKNMAWYIYRLLEHGRKLVEDPAKMKGFISTTTYLMSLFEKGLIKVYYRTRETIDQFGGLGKVLKTLSIIFGTFIGIQTLTLFGKFAASLLGIFNIFSHWKLTLFGAGLLLFMGVVEDFLAFMAGKEKTITGEVLNILETKYPEAFKGIKKWLSILKTEVEGLTLLFVGLFKGIATGNWTIAEEGLKRIDIAYKKILEPTKDIVAGKIDVTGMNRIEKIIAGSPLLVRMSEIVESMKVSVDRAFGTKSEHVPMEINASRLLGKILPETIFSLRGPGESYLSALGRNMTQGERRERLSGLKMEFPINVTVTNNNSAMDEEKLANNIVKHVEPVVDKKLDALWRSEYSNLTPREY